MQLRFALLVAALAAAAPIGAHAETAIGGSYLYNRETGGPFAGNDSGYRVFLGGYRSTAGAEVAFVNFGRLGGGDGPHAQAWTSDVRFGVPIWKLQTFVKVGLARSRVSGTAISEESNHYRIFYGGGIRVGEDKGFGVRAEYERYKLDSDALEVIAGSIDYRF